MRMLSPIARKPALLAGCLAASLSLAVSPLAQAQVSTLAGVWAGGGQVKLDDGRTERVSCRAYYTPRDSGSGLGLALRCASPSYKIELRSSLKIEGGTVSGSWEERSFNASGSISGTSSGNTLNLSFSGTLSGSMVVNTSGASQRVSITSASGGLSRVSLSLSKG